MISKLKRAGGIFLIAIVYFCSIVSSNYHAPAWTCGNPLQINQTNPGNFTHLLGKDDAQCKWELIGDRGCEVEVSCEVDLPEDPDECGENYLQITDAYRGSQKYCGKVKVKPIRASEGLRDLFVVLSTIGSWKGKHRGIECSAKCVLDPLTSKTKRLDQNWERDMEYQCVCGMQSGDDRIVGGEDAEYNEFPWLVAIVPKGTRAPLCGGSLINDQFVLTAAHCSVLQGGKKAEELEVLLHAHTLDMTVLPPFENMTITEKDTGSGFNSTRRTDLDEKTRRLAVAEIINHPLYLTNGEDYDYSLLRLKKELDMDEEDSPTPICIPPPTTYDSFNLTGKNLLVAGWGLANEKFKATTKVLQKLSIPYMDQQKCKNIYKKLFSGRMFCCGFDEGGKDACNGDSGGPLIYEMPSEQWWQFGVVSWGVGCARANRPGVFAQVTEAAQWIHFHSAHHDAEWCDDDVTTGE